MTSDCVKRKRLTRRTASAWRAIPGKYRNIVLEGMSIGAEDADVASNAEGDHLSMCAEATRAAAAVLREVGRG